MPRLNQFGPKKEEKVVEEVLNEVQEEEEQVAPAKLSQEKNEVRLEIVTENMLLNVKMDQILSNQEKIMNFLDFLSKE